MRTVFITGGSGGIGNAIVQRYTKAGYSILAPSRNELDLASRESLEHYVKNCTQPVDILINAAGVNIVQHLQEITWDIFEQTLAINLRATLFLTQAFAVGMQKRQWGRIVNVSSCYSIVSREGRATYTASKAGLNGLTRTLALELAPFNILVNAICPGFVETALTRKNNSETELLRLKNDIPLHRFADPEEIAEAVFFLGSEQNTYITGQAILADGGFTCK